MSETKHTIGDEISVMRQAKSEGFSNITKYETFIREYGFCFIKSYTPTINVELWTNQSDIDWVIHILHLKSFQNFTLNNDYKFIDCRNNFSSSPKSPTIKNLAFSYEIPIISGLALCFTALAFILYKKVFKDKHKLSYDKLNPAEELELGTDLEPRYISRYISLDDRKSNLISWLTNTLKKLHEEKLESFTYDEYGVAAERFNLEDDVQLALSAFPEYPYTNELGASFASYIRDEANKFENADPNFHNTAKQMVNFIFDPLESKEQEIIGELQPNNAEMQLP